ncbi:hypothetical protein [Halarchaeum sp. P4]|uniref:hypothetical protein n=1 Tax=Halarchaeum sp. P4 TaxID=3421639 RepID=UPI003EBC7F53
MSSDGSGARDRDWDALLDDAGDGDESSGDERADADARRSGRLAGARRRLGRLFSPRHFLLLLAVALAGLFVGGFVPLVGAITRFLGLFVATFLVGVLGGRRVYAEVASASALATVAALLVGLLSSGLFPVAADFLARHGVAFALGAAALGLVVGTVGYYFGRDLRAGVTRSL